MQTALLPVFQRGNFQGRSDHYSPPNVMGSGVNAQLAEALKGLRPVDVAGSVLGDQYVNDAVSRLTNYKKYWNYYDGRHFTVEYDGGDKKIPWNYCRKIVNKRAAWVCGKGFNLITEKGNEFVGEFLTRVWKSNNIKSLIRKSAKAAIGLGDAYWYFTLNTKDSKGQTLPKDKWRVKIHTLNPAFVFPLFAEDNPNKMRGCMIQFPVWRPEGNDSAMFTILYTPDRIRTWIDHAEQSNVPNNLGVIPVVHIPGETVGDRIFGDSALKDIVPLNDAYNEIAQSIRKILKYHGEPTTIVYGTKLANLEKGANKVWSNLPPPNEARVENLELKSDLAAANIQLERLEAQMYRHGKTPEVAFDSKGLAISNTSGIAMQLLFQPLVEATIEQQEPFEFAIHQGNNIIAALHQNILGDDLSVLADTPESYLDMDIQWLSLMPKDEQVELDIAAKKVELGIWSKAEAQRRIAGVRDTSRLALELAADCRYEIAVAAEKARAMQVGANPPNFNCATLSSIFLSEDLVDIASQMDKDGETSEDEED
jgi:hypothetical protein